MKAIIIPKSQRSNYDKQFDTYNAIKPFELITGDFGMHPEVLIMLQGYVDGNYPQSIKAAASYTISELQEFELREITESDLKQGVLPEEVELFPYDGLNIRVFIEHKAITAMLESPYKALIDLALLCTKEVSESGVTIWLKQLENEFMTAEQVRAILDSFGSQILIK